MNRFGITLTKYVCQIYDGKKMIHQVPVDGDDSTSIRNLYLMLYASDYNVLTFLSKYESKEFESFDEGRTNGHSSKVQPTP